MAGLSSGQRVGQYEIIDTLGEGGMAVVYRAREMNVDREIALKVIKASLTGLDETLERFKREANTIARLSHPHILKLFQFGEHNDTIYLAIELMRGGSLREAIKTQGQLPLNLITRVLEQIGAALDYAHKRGIVHRDLKPQNILLDEDGNAFLTDFGIAKLLNEAKLTQDGLMLGTPSYIAPEQWVGEPADSRTDLYALGVMLFEMLTGQVPFRGKSPVEMAKLHTREQPPSVVKLRPALPPAVEDVVNRALAKNRAERYQTAGELVDALKLALSGAASSSVAAKSQAAPAGATMIESAAPVRPISTPTGRMPVYVPPVGNRRRLIGMITGGVAALVIVGFGFFLLSQRPNQSVAVVSSATATPTIANTATPQIIAPITLATTAQASAPPTASTSTATRAATSVPTATNTLVPTRSPTVGATATLDPTVAAMLNAVDTPTPQTTAVAAAATQTVPPTSVPTDAATAPPTVTLAITLARTTAVPTATTANPTQAPTQEPTTVPTITATVWATQVDPAEPTVTLAITLAGRTPTRAAAATSTQGSSSSTEAAALSTLVPPSSDVMVVVKTNNASIRRGPGLGHPWISNVKNGEQFPVVSKTTARDGNLWYEIRAANGSPAWIWAQYVNLQPADAQVADAQITPTQVPPRPTATAGLEYITFVNNGPNSIDVFAGGTYAFTVAPGARRSYGGRFANGARVQVVGVTFVMRDTKTGQTKAVVARTSPSSASYP